MQLHDSNSCNFMTAATAAMYATSRQQQLQLHDSNSSSNICKFTTATAAAMYATS
jgi:hypothetical protein